MRLRKMLDAHAAMLAAGLKRDLDLPRAHLVFERAPDDALTMAWLPEDFGGPFKQMFVAATRALLAEADAVRLILVMEAWMLDGDAAQRYVERHGRRGGSVQDAPGRFECISYACEDALTGEILLAYHRLETRDGKLVPGTLQPLCVTPPSTYAEGNMIGLLKPRGKMQ